MPYIKPHLRKEIGFKTDHLDPINGGEVNYLFTQVCKNYLENKGESYETFNDLLGALEGCKFELYRRKIAPYEDKKIIENGDVYHGPTRKAKAASPPQELRSEGVEL